MPLFSFFRKKDARRKEARQSNPGSGPAQGPETPAPTAKDFNWFLRRLLLNAEAAGWNKGTVPNAALVQLAGETSGRIEKRIFAACQEAGVSDADSIMRRIAGACFFAGIVSCWHWDRNRKAVEAAGLYWTITHESPIERAEPYALFLMGLDDGRGVPTAKGRELAAFAGKEAQDAAHELHAILVQQGRDEFAATLAAAREAMFVAGTIAGDALMPEARP